MEFWSYQLRFLWYFSGVKFLSSLIKMFSLLMNRLKSLSWSSLLFGGDSRTFLKIFKSIEKYQDNFKERRTRKIDRWFPEIFSDCYFNSLGDHPLSTYAKFSEKLTFLTLWYAHVRVRIMGLEIIVFGKIYVHT